MVQRFIEPDLKSGGPGFKFNRRPRLYIASWFASCQIGFLTCYLFPVVSEWNACKLALGRYIFLYFLFGLISSQVLSWSFQDPL